MFSNSVRKAKIHRVVVPVRNIKSNKKIFCGYSISKGLKREMLKWEGDAEARDAN